MLEDADSNLIKQWDEKYQACLRNRSKFEQQWHLNMAFYFGRQYVHLGSKATNEAGYMLFDLPKNEPWRVRAVRNKIKRAVRNEMTKLTKEEPQGYVIPDSTEEEDRLVAVAAEALAEYHVASSNFRSKRFLATFWTTICGTGFLKTYYDKVAKTEDGSSGRVMYDGVSPFHLVVPYLQCPDIEEQPYVMHCRTLEASLVKEFYDKDIVPNTEVSASIMDQRFFASLGINNQQEKKIKQVFVKEVWVKPCKEFPEGAMFIYADKTLLYMNEETVEVPDPTDGEQLAIPSMERPGLPEPSRFYPYNHGRFPFQKIDHIPTGMFYGESTIKDLIPIQKDYNRLRSQMIEYRNLAIAPAWAMKKGSIDPKSWTPNKPGTVVQVNPGFDEPKPLTPPDLPAQTPQELDLNNREFDDVSGQFEISKGRTPPGVEAASAIAFLQEENDTILYHTVASLERAVEESGKQTLDLIQQEWDAERITRTISKNNSMEAILFKDIAFKPGLDYRIVKDSMAPRSRAAKQAMISDLMKQGAIEVRDAMRFFQMAETNTLYKEINVDYEQAERENVLMARSGQPLLRQDGVEQAPIDPNSMFPVMQEQPTYKMVPDMTQLDPASGQPAMKYQTINDYDDHAIHAKEHSRYMKTQQYEVLPWSTKKIFEDHLKEHEEKLQAELMEEQMMQLQQAIPEQSPQEIGQP